MRNLAVQEVGVTVYVLYQDISMSPKKPLLEHLLFPRWYWFFSSRACTKQSVQNAAAAVFISSISRDSMSTWERLVGGIANVEKYGLGETEATLL